MQFRTIVITIIVGMWLVGLLLMAGTGKNYNDEPIQRPIDKILETSKPDPNNFGYNEYDEFNGYGDAEDDFEYQDGITTP